MDDKTLFADGSLSSIHTRARNRNSFRHRKDIDWMAGCASKARPPMAGTPACIQRSQPIRGRYHDRYLVVSEAGTSVIRFEQLGRMALISPYVIDTRIQPLRALLVISYEPYPALSRKNRSNQGWEHHTTLYTVSRWALLRNRSVTLRGAQKTKRVLSFGFLPVFPVRYQFKAIEDLSG